MGRDGKTVAKGEGREEEGRKEKGRAWYMVNTRCDCQVKKSLRPLLKPLL